MRVGRNFIKLRQAGWTAKERKVMSYIGVGIVSAFWQVQ